MGRGPKGDWMMEGLVRMMGHGIRGRLERDREARRWIRGLRRTVALEMEGVGSVTVRFRSGRVDIRPGSARAADYRVHGPYEDLVGYINGEVGLSEILSKMATGRIRVTIGRGHSLRELWTILRMEDLFVIARKREPFPLSLVDLLRRLALSVPRVVPLVEVLPL